ncbi:hypothetical protein Q4519_22135, partial [Motilimonas sp. 1_MG-2023]|uniref:hypothetical protein n=1 Tax=Motilimonas sp. 1_MG-2023 TaxID=3062672 RepID=UPI0026E1D320
LNLKSQENMVFQNFINKNNQKHMKHRNDNQINIAEHKKKIDQTKNIIIKGHKFMLLKIIHKIYIN